MVEKQPATCKYVILITFGMTFGFTLYAYTYTDHMKTLSDTYLDRVGFFTKEPPENAESYNVDQAVKLMSGNDEVHILKNSSRAKSTAYPKPHKVAMHEWVMSNTTTSQMLYDANEDRLKEALKKADEKITILYWSLPFGTMGMITGFNNLDRDRCGNCQVSADRGMINDNSTKALVFHFNEFRDVLGFPKPRNPNHFYVWWTLEGPQALRMRSMGLGNFNNAFNLTMTFRRESDVYQPYGTAEKLYKELKKDNITEYLQQLVKGKTRMAIWIASNGFMRGARERRALSEQLVNAGLDLDRRGGLFPKQPLPNGRGPEFVKFIRNYKFYMSMENQWHCKGYFTEKVWNNGLRAEAIPVVWGARKEDYLDALPPGSFIFASDYTPTELTKYLQYLDKNDTAYLEYFHWRTLTIEEMPDYHRETGVCQLCRILHGINIDNVFNPVYRDKYSSIPLFTDDPPKRTVPSLQAAFYGTDYPECH